MIMTAVARALGFLESRFPDAGDLRPTLSLGSRGHKSVGAVRNSAGEVWSAAVEMLSVADGMLSVAGDVLSVADEMLSVADKMLSAAGDTRGKDGLHRWRRRVCLGRCAAVPVRV